ncbi:hypothetical protein L218DRAFT_958248 [Marasmius fiardii PR-910]|nr:hypothetical protein L218DRAFT_958248 [Marasmius fiardii PR-910]
MNVNTPPSDPPPSIQFSEIEKLFRSSVSSSDRNDISAYLNTAEKELKGYDIEINRLRETLLSLENRKERLRHRIHRYCSLLSPIHRLPAEMLTNIFKHACDETPELSLDDIPQAFLLSAVCGRWREIVNSTPFLWADLGLNTWLYCDPDFPRFMRILRLFLDRSESAPLSLTLSMRQVEFEPPVIELLGVLSQIIRSCRRIDLDIPIEILEHSALQLLPSDPHLSPLQHLSLWSPTDRHVNHFNQCSALTSLEIRMMRAPFRSSREWPGIKDLKISTQSEAISLIASLLEVCPNVDGLVVVAGSQSIPPTLEIPAVTSRLKSLKLRCINCPLIPFFRYFSLPNLLDLDICWSMNKWDLNVFKDFLSRSGCNITYLTLSPPRKSDMDDVLSFLRLLPSIRELRLATVRAPLHAFLNRLSVKQGRSFGTPLLPRLTDLTLAISRQDFEEEPLVHAVTSRWLPDPKDESEVGIACLRSLRVEVMDKGWTPSLDSLLYLRRAGLKVDVFAA